MQKLMQNGMFFSPEKGWKSFTLPGGQTNFVFVQRTQAARRYRVAAVGPGPRRAG